MLMSYMNCHGLCCFAVPLLPLTAAAESAMYEGAMQLTCMLRDHQARLL